MKLIAIVLPALAMGAIMGVVGGDIVGEARSYPTSDIEGARAARRCQKQCDSETASKTVSLEECWGDLYDAKHYATAECEALRETNALALRDCWDELIEIEVGTR